DDEVADDPADEGAAQEDLQGQAVLGRGLVAEDAEQQPTEEPAERPEDGVVVDANEQSHEWGSSAADRVSGVGSEHQGAFRSPGAPAPPGPPGSTATRAPRR